MKCENVQNHLSANKKRTMQHTFLQSAIFWQTYLSLLNLLSLSLSSPSLYQYQSDPHRPVLDSHTSQDPEEVCLVVHPMPGTTNLKGRVSRLRAAGEELYRLTLFSASCCGAPSSSLFLSCVSYFCISPLFHLSHSLSECRGLRPQQQQVAFYYRPAQAALIAFCHHWEFGMCMCLCTSGYSKPPHWSGRQYGYSKLLHVRVTTTWPLNLAVRERWTRSQHKKFNMTFIYLIVFSYLYQDG